MFVMNVSMSTMSAIHGLGVHNLTITAAEMEPAVKVSTYMRIVVLKLRLLIKENSTLLSFKFSP